MENPAKVVIQAVNPQEITLSINGEIQKIRTELAALHTLLKQSQTQSFQTADKIYNIGSITNANFGVLLEQLAPNRKLPTDLADNLLTDPISWTKSLQQTLLRQGVSVGNDAMSIFQHYGWLISSFLQKMASTPGRQRNLKRLSYMVEVYQSSLRYLSYIQLAQLLTTTKQDSVAVADFLQLEQADIRQFDFLNFLLASIDELPEEQAFMPEIYELLEEIVEEESDVRGTVLYLQSYRNKLLQGSIPTDEGLNQILDEYLTALVFWLRQLAFLTQYKLVSIKDINLKYQVGTAKTFVHIYGELHGMYRSNDTTFADTVTTPLTAYQYSIDDKFTYNKSVLLLKGRNVASGFDKIEDSSSYLSLSPLIIDQSVFLDSTTQTPDIYYYTGRGKRKYYYSHYRNELSLDAETTLPSHKEIIIKKQNTRVPLFDELYEQNQRIFQLPKSNRI